MAQFDVYLLRDGSHVVDVQSPLAHLHPTRLVIPLLELAEAAPTISRLNPRVTLNEEQWILGVQFTSTIDMRQLKSAVGSLEADEWTIKRALDFLINGY